MMTYILIIILILLVSVVAWKYKLADLLAKKFVESIKKGEAVSTSIDDVPHFEGIEDYSPQPVSDEVMNELAQNGKVTLGPGVYDFYLQSFCLDAGRHGPSSDSAYLVAPLKGKRSSIVRNILKNSTGQPDIPQHKIQTLIWAISSDIKYGEMSRDLQLIAGHLLAEDDLRSLGKSFLDKIPKPIRDRLLRELKKRLPKEILHILDAADDIKWKIADARTTYEELERIAIRLGKAPIPKDMQKIEVGRWSFVQGSGYYFVRVFPKGYSCSRVQVYVPDKKSIPESVSVSVDKVHDFFSDSENARRLMLETAAAESLMGTYKGKWNPVAKGIWQVEPNTAKDNYVNYLKYRTQLLERIKNEFSIDIAKEHKEGWKNLENPIINALMARIKYARIESKGASYSIPDTLQRRAEYWATYYNAKYRKGTEDWKGRVNHYLKNVNLFAITISQDTLKINFNPSNYVAVPANTNEQRLGFRGIKCGR